MALETPSVVPAYVVLLDDMTKVDPSERPLAAMALETLNSIIADLHATTNAS
jgi:hypothetical protein